MKGLRTVFALSTIIIAAAFAVLWYTHSDYASPVHVHMAPESQLPAFLDGAESRIRDAYRFAIANPDVLDHIPCYCGCSFMGHMNTTDCYIKLQLPSGLFAFDQHARGCGICVDITWDVMKMMRQGKALPEIRTYIDATYSRYGPSTNTPHIMG
jgi:hypothetical protein